MTKEVLVKRFFCALPIAALVCTTPFLAACDRKDNTPNFESRVQDKLKDANVKDVNANWNKDEKALHLTGKVDAAAEKARAETIASQVVGTSGRIVNEVKVEGVDTRADDSAIEQRLDKMFKEDDQWDRDNLDLTFHSTAGVVTIKGDAPSQALKDRIGTTVRSVEGVKDVVNDLQIKPAKEPSPKNTKAHSNKVKGHTK
jgi:osmotically-inducible protein OsmY